MRKGKKKNGYITYYLKTLKDFTWKMGLTVLINSKVFNFFFHSSFNFWLLQAF
jgi:hypothetical protein